MSRDGRANERSGGAGGSPSELGGQTPFRTMADCAPVMLWMTGPDAECVYVNRRWLEFTGRRLEQELGHGWIDSIHPDDRARCLNAYLEAFAARASCSIDYRLHRFDGEWRWIRDRGIPHSAPDGAFGGYVGACVDVTEELEADGARREVEERLRRIYELAPIGIVNVDATGRFLHSNPAFQRMLLYSEEELRHLSIADVTGGEALEDTLRQFEALRLGHLAVLSLDKPCRRKDGATRWSHVNAVAVRDGEGRFVQVVAAIQDITERRALQEQLFHAQKMETVGRLAGGVAHEFNNLLTAILGRAQLARDVLPPGHSATSDLRVIEQAALRAAKLCQGLLAFGRRQPAEPRSIDVAELVRDMRGILAPLIGERISVDIDLASELWSALADPTHVEQVLINLAVNARDAMPSGGRLRLRAANVQLDADGAGPRELASPGEYVRIEVEDEGHGMGPEVREHVFEPFFTTKEPGKGTGLGLATCYGLVKESGGAIDFDSEPGRGTTFRVYLPRGPRVPGAAQPAAAGAVPAK